ncbi:Ig-like domain repeat protein [Leucobacter sp. NPDC058333]|uniref:Ig-like domain repeat protein n=1 Tax=Leucobacter sp. NPDC058333 TaxID=3346450 RepID=UPI0036686CF0
MTQTGAGVAAALALVGSAFVAPIALATPALAVEGVPAATATPHVSEVRWTGEAGGDLGFAASRTSCDVNGDGVDDAVVGDWWWSRGTTKNAGAAYVLLGGSDPVGGMIGTGEAVGAVRIDGPNTTNAFAGQSVSCLNDVNGDGIDDLLIGSNRTQRAWVILGATDFEPVDVDSLGTRGFEITNSAAVAENSVPGGSANFGYAVTGLGDVNGDGLADFAIVDNLYDRPADAAAGTPIASNIGRVWVIAGSEDVSTIDVASGAGEGRVLQSIDGGVGQLVSAESVGDLNGDGLADLVVGSYGAIPWGSASPVAGAAYAIFGSDAPQQVDTGALGAHGFAVYGPQRGRDRLGTSIAALGDINGDGLADFAVGGDGVSNAATGPRPGGAAIVTGAASLQTVFTVPGVDQNAVYSCNDETTNTSGTCDADQAPRGYWIEGAADNDKFGWAAAGITDVSGDGVPEVVLGAWGHDSGGANAGAIYVVNGQPGFSGTLSAGSLDASSGFRIDGAVAGAQLGRSVGSVSDFDGNGVPDVVGGANGTDYSSVYLLGAAVTSINLEPGELSVADGGTITAKLSAGQSAGDVTGSVSFAIDGVAIAECEAMAVISGSAACSAAEFSAGGSAIVSARFIDESGAFAESKAEQRVDIAKIAAAVTVSGDATGTALDELAFTATVPAEATGEVEFRAGAQSLGSAPIEGGSATLTTVPQTAGSYQLTAKYSGDARYATGASKARRVTVSHVPVYLSTIRLNAARAVYGVRPTAAVTVQGAEAGVVLFTSGSRDLGTAQVGPGGVATLRLPAVSVGNYRITAQYLGDDTYADSAARTTPGTLQVVRASVSSAKVVTSTAKKGSRPAATVKLGKLNNGSYPTGKVTVSFGSAKQTVALSAAQHGIVKVRAPKALRSNTKVTAKYLGSANVNSKSATATQRVK